MSNSDKKEAVLEQLAKLTAMMNDEGSTYVDYYIKFFRYQNLSIPQLEEIIALPFLLQHVDLRFIGIRCRWAYHSN